MTIYRKYRPQNFKELIGQNNARATLQQALIKKKVSHAYLFAGPRGTGKTSTARIFARSVCCLSPHTNNSSSYNPCGKCSSCLYIQDNSLDIIEIDAASNRSIEDIREIKEQILYKPQHLPYKIYIIDEVHMLSTEAFNALLKTLEEPPEWCIFILASTEIQKIPLTIRSRCQLIQFHKATTEEVSKKLEHIIKNEGYIVEDQVCQMIAEQADGAYRDAETILENLATQNNSLTNKSVQSQLGILDKKIVESLIMAELGGDNNTTVDILKNILANDSINFGHLNEQAIYSIRHKIYSQNIAPTVYPILYYALQQYLEASILYKYAPISYLPFEVATFNILNFCNSYPSIDHQHNNKSSKFNPLTSLEQQPKNIQNNTSTVVPLAITKDPIISSPASLCIPPLNSVPVVEIGSPPMTDIRLAWKKCTDLTASHNIPLSQVLRDSVIHRIEANTIIVLVRFKFHADKLKEKRNLAFILDTLLQLTDQAWEIIFEVSPNLPKLKPDKQLPGQNLSEASEEIFNKPN
jgi:DNA polymerase III subunit gamma/tau